MIFGAPGMRKSATTLLADILRTLGKRLIARAEGGDYDWDGHFERNRTGRINKELLAHGNINCIEVMHPQESCRWPDDIHTKPQAAMLKIRRDHRGWRRKVSITCLVYGIWREMLHLHRFVFIHLQPWRLVAHCTTKLSGSSLALATKALRAWHVYNEQALGRLRHTDLPWIKLNYSTLMGGDRPFRALCSFVGGELDDVRSVDHYRSRVGRSFAYRWARFRVRRLYGLDVDELCQSLAELPEQGGGRTLRAPYATGRP